LHFLPFLSEKSVFEFFTFDACNSLKETKKWVEPSPVADFVHLSTLKLK